MTTEQFIDPSTGRTVIASRGMDMGYALPAQPAAEAPLAPGETFKVDPTRLTDHTYFMAHKAAILKAVYDGELN